MAQEIRIVLNTDASGMVSGNAAGSRSLSELVRQSQAAGRGMQSLNTTVSDNSRAMRALSPQITDIVVGLSSGQSPLTVLVQQGGQLKDMFGGIVPAMRALGGLVTVSNVAFAAAAISIGAYVKAMADGQEQSKRFATVGTLTGGSLGMTESAFTSLTQRVSTATAATVGAAREMADAFAASGRVTGASLESITTAALRLQKLTGDSTQSIVSDMLDMGRGVTEWATKHNESWHFMTAAQVDHVRQLEETGRKEEAMGVVLGALNKHLTTNASFWDKVRAAASAAWDVMVGTGRVETVADRLAQARKSLLEWTNSTATFRNSETGQRSLQQIQDTIKTLNADALREQNGATDKAYAANSEQEAINRRRALKALTDQLTGATSEYAKAVKTINESDASDGEKKRLLGLAEKQLNRKGGKTAAERKAEEERLYQEKVQGILKNRPVRLVDIEAKGYEEANRAAEQNMAHAAEMQRRRNDMADQLGQQYLDSATQINIGLIRDDAERGRAQIEQERLTAQQRIDIYSAMGADVSAAEDGLASYILARNRQLEEELKPQWQRNLDNWSDTNRLMRDAYNSTMDGLVSDGEQAWIQMGLGAKLGAKQLIDSVLAEMLRLQYRQNIAGPFSNAIASVIGSMFGDTLTVDTSGTGITAPDNSLVSNGIGAGRASGGKVFARSLHPVVERGEPEVLNTSGGTYLLTGSQSGYVTPLRSAQSAQGGGSGGGQPIVNVHNYGDNQVEASSSAGSNGEAIIDIVVRKVKGEMASDIAGGGTFSRTLSNTFGLSRKTAARG